MKTANTHLRGGLVLAGLCILGVACSDSSSGRKRAASEVYSAAAFAYVDPSPPQPLQRVRTDVVRRDEAAILLPAAPGQMLDYNQNPWGPVVTGLPALPQETFALASGRIDRDSDMDILAAHLRKAGGGWTFEIARLEHAPAMAWMPVYSAPMPTGLRDVHLAAGDVDADGLDEIVVAYRCTSRGYVEALVLDDLEHGAALLDARAYIDQHGEQLEVALGDLDGDGADEIVLSAVDGDCLAIEVVRAGERSDAFDDYFLRDRYAQPAFLRIGEFDDETADKELLAGFFRLEPDPTWGTLNRQYELTRLDLIDGLLQETGATRLGEWNESIVSDWVVADTDGDEADEVFLVCDSCLHVMQPGALLEQPTWEHGIEPVTRIHDLSEVHLAAGDEDGDGLDEVFVMGRTELMRIGLSEQGALAVNELRDLGELPKGPRLLVGDYDGDSTVIVNTGARELSLCEAFPLVVMAAPPRKEGSGQRRAEASTGYDIQAGASHTVWSGATLTVGPAFTVETNGRFKRALLREFAKTGTPRALESDVATFETGWQEDKVLFCGALYQSYGYEVLADADPAAIGSAFTIDVPVCARTFFWSLEDYNATFMHKVTPDVLGHTVGDPASYMGLAQAQALQTMYVGWLSPEFQDVAQGRDFTEQQLAPTFVDPTATGWCTPISERVGLRTGPTWGAACLALASEANIHYVTTRTAALFTGTVGDLPARSYDKWGFEYALLAYTLGQTSDANNTPTGCEPGVLPCQVVTYAVCPWGSGY